MKKNTLLRMIDRGYGILITPGGLAFLTLNGSVVGGNPVSAITTAAALVGGGLLKKKSDKQAAQSVIDQNAANRELHSMTPEEKANYFSSGVTKVNDATVSSQGLLDRNLAARGLGGNAVVAPNANLQRTRIKSIADVWNELTRTAMNMRAGTPSAQAVPPVPSVGQNILQPIFDIAGQAGGKVLGNKLGALFG